MRTRSISVSLSIHTCATTVWRRPKVEWKDYDVSIIPLAIERSVYTVYTTIEMACFFSPRLGVPSTFLSLFTFGGYLYIEHSISESVSYG